MSDHEWLSPFLAVVLVIVVALQFLSDREQDRRMDILSDRVEAQRLEIMDLEAGR